LSGQHAFPTGHPPPPPPPQHPQIPLLLLLSASSREKKSISIQVCIVPHVPFAGEASECAHMRAINQHRFRARHASPPSAVLAHFVVAALLLASVQTVFSDVCDERSCDAVLDQAQVMVLATGTEGEAVALAARASSMLSASNYTCCLRVPAIRIRSALVSDLHLLPHHSTIIPAAATFNTLTRYMQRPRLSSGSTCPAQHCSFPYSLCRWHPINSAWPPRCFEPMLLRSS
jgi:hypothetical protein